MKVILNESLPEFSDKVILDETVLEKVLLEDKEPDFPLIFQAKNGGQIGFFGVREFTAARDTVQVSKSVYRQLNEPEELEVQRISVLKGSFLSVELENSGPDDEKLKYLLEAHLTENYTVLTKNQTFSVKDLDNIYEFKVIETKPEDTICLIDTDLEFDVLRKPGIPRAQPHSGVENTKVISSNLTRATKSGEYELQSDEVLEFSLDKLEIGDIQGELVMSTTTRCDIIVSKDRFLTADAFIWSNCGQPYTEKRSVEIPISSSNSYYVRILPWEDTDAKFKINIDIGTTQNTVDEEEYAAIEGIQCTNCSKYVTSNYQLHQTFCFRNNIKCPHGCGKVFLKIIPPTHWHCSNCNCYGEDPQLKSHHQQFCHIECTLEDQSFENKLQCAKFAATSYSKRLHECRFCHLIVEAGKSEPQDTFLGLTHHENAVCGSKTIECPKCNRILKQRDFESHYKLHELKRKTQQLTQQKCSNVNCVAVYTPSSSDILPLCAQCVSTVYTNIHDPTNAKLKARIERKYILQLTRGCGNSFCKNVQCLSSGLSVKKSLKETIEMIKTQLLDSDIFYFCVNDTMTRRKLSVDAFYEGVIDDKPVKDVYDYVWICLAFEKVNSAVDAVHWLTENAVRLDE